MSAPRDSNMSSSSGITTNSLISEISVLLSNPSFSSPSSPLTPQLPSFPHIDDASPSVKSYHPLLPKPIGDESDIPFGEYFPFLFKESTKPGM